mgnify:FL=1
MNNTEFLNELEQARQLAQKGELDTALKIFDQLYATDNNEQNLSLVYYMQNVLKQAGDYDKAIEIGLSAFKLPEVWDSIRHNTAWCIYFQYFKDKCELPVEDAIEWLEKIKELFPSAPGLHPLPLSVFSYINKHPELPPALIIQLCLLLDPQKLETEPVPNKNGKFPFPSQREKYITILTKAYFATENYNECLDLCQETLNSSLPLTPNEPIWLKRRIALCHSHLGEEEKALQEMKEILQTKKDWFLYYEAATISFTLKNIEEAVDFAIRAALGPGDIENKIHLWELLKSILLELKLFDKAVEMLQFIVSIRKFKQWSIPQSLNKELNSYHISLDNLPHYKELFSRFRKWLPELLSKNAQELSGNIKFLLPHKKAGFISSGKETYYFRTADCQIPVDDIQPGLKVKFIVQPGFDAKKQKETLVATNIQKE